jgi:hypothetical protein
MSQKNIFFIISIMLLLCIGMWRYAVLWQADQRLLVDVRSDTQLTEGSTVSPREGVEITDTYIPPVPNSAPTQNVQHTVVLTDIKRGCFRQDCIPSVENPLFVPASELLDVLSTTSLGIVLWEVVDFIPFQCLRLTSLLTKLYLTDRLF